DPGNPLITAGFQYRAPSASTPAAVEAPAIERCTAPDPEINSPCARATGEPTATARTTRTWKPQRFCMADLRRWQGGQRQLNAPEPAVRSGPRGALVVSRMTVIGLPCDLIGTFWRFRP